MKTASDILLLWPTSSALADDLSVPADTVRKWLKRESIPSEYWLEIVASARRRRIRGVTLTRLATIDAAYPRKRKDQ